MPRVAYGLIPLLFLPLLPLALTGEGTKQLSLKIVDPSRPVHVHAWLKDPAKPITARLEVKGTNARKTLHAFDWDWSQTISAPNAGTTITLDLPEGVDAELRYSTGIAPGVSMATAAPVKVNEPIEAEADERPFIPEQANDAAALAQGVHWYKFTAPPQDTMLALSVDTPLRELPMDIDLFDAQGTPYREGDHLYRPEATQNLPGLAAFRTRRIRANQQYFVRVAANHPSYTLHLNTFEAPPYLRDPQKAVRTGLDYLVALGDSWLANIPRRGSVATRDTIPHADTQNCVACHPTQFTARAALTAKANGYMPPAALQRILDQLENNPRPLPGHHGATWSRMIFSARTISSRLPLLLVAGGRQRPDITQGAVRFLELHYKDRDTLAGEEADGASPAVSPIEIALQSWQTYGLADPNHPRRVQLAKFIETFDPKNVVDLNWKLIAFAELGRPTDALAKTLLQHQRPNGTFAYDFGTSAPSADFVSYHALYALAKAGVRSQKLIDYTLSRQQAWGGWQGEPVVKAFHTPFRETQFAIMALSTLFPEKHSNVQVTSAGRKANPASTRKTERIEAALQLRHRANAGEPAPLLATLQSSDPRVRWTGLYAFTAHFRAATQSAALRDALTHLVANDPAPANRMLAAQALTRWNTWDPAPAILDALAARVKVEPDHRVRRSLQEGIYNILDDNIGYAESWMRAMSREEDRQKTVAAMHARSGQQSRILAKHLTGDGALHILNAMWDLPLRHMAIPQANKDRAEVVLPAYYAEFREGVADFDQYPPYSEAVGFEYATSNGFHKTRVGNDSDLIDLTGAGPELENALIAFIEGSNPDLAIAAVKAGSSLGGAMTPRFTAAVLRRASMQQDEVAKSIAYVYASDARGTLPAGESEELRKALIAAVPRAPQLALGVAAKLPFGTTLLRDPELVSAIEKQLFAPQPPASAIQAAAVFPRVADGPLIRTVILDALTSGDRSREAAAVELVVRNYFANPTVQALAAQFGRAAKGRVRRLMVDSLDPERFALNVSALSLYNNPGGAKFLEQDANLFSNEVVQDFVRDSLRDPYPQVRRATEDLIRQQSSLRRVLGMQTAPPKADVKPLDYEYFVAKVQPLLAKPGEDGKACVQCHASHGKFPLRLPSHKTGFTEAQSRQNYDFIQRVINRDEPRKSLVLIKPTRPNDSAGDPNLFLATHAGGQRWQGNDTSEQYETILNWIRGARNP
ncbi:hypothetical protein F183_A33320 [Bryobacterales bacterium F-183]|nr:hypothetical protein F183_A33320 [Bryobacterales bacterium F-183]